MNQSFFWSCCEDKLTHLAARIEVRAKKNILDLNIHAEDFYQRFLNLLFGYSLENMNVLAPNSPGLDLKDARRKLVVQVSSTASKAKVESALSKNLAEYAGWSFNFVSIAKDASSLRKMSYKNPHGLVFSPPSDIHDVCSLLDKIQSLSIPEMRKIYYFLREELGSQEQNISSESNLAALINILAKEGADIKKSSSMTEAFSVENKISFNNLQEAKVIIEDFKVLHPKIDRTYSVFDAEGQNRSTSVLNWMRQCYLRLSKKYSGDELFFQVVEETASHIKGSSNYQMIPAEELLLWVSALVVDAFIRCKIFKNPRDFENVVA